MKFEAKNCNIEQEGMMKRDDGVKQKSYEILKELKLLPELFERKELGKVEKILDLLTNSEDSDLPKKLQKCFVMCNSLVISYIESHK